MAVKKNIDYLVVNVDNGEIRILNGQFWLTKNFQVWELACKDGSDIIFYSQETLDGVQRMRDYFGPTTINSGSRTPRYNKRCGSTSLNHIMYGAIDFKQYRGVTIDQMYEKWIELNGDDWGIGRYYTKKFMHVDRKSKRRWFGSQDNK